MIQLRDHESFERQDAYKYPETANIKKTFNDTRINESIGRLKQSHVTKPDFSSSFLTELRLKVEPSD